MESDYLRNRVIVVAGANGRLGRRLVPLFAQAGARVAALVEFPEETSEVPFPSGARRWAQAIDAADDAQAAAAMETISRDVGHIYAVFNAIGMWSGKPLAETELDDWNLSMRVNLTTTFLLFREALKYMGDGPGRLIAMASGQGKDRGVAEQPAYSAAKAGVMRLVESVADEYKATLITAHAIAPSYIIFDDTSDEPGVKARDIGQLALYLLGPAGEAHNGATIAAYGSRM